MLTRSAYDHKRVRSLMPPGGGGQISRAYRLRTGEPGSYAKSSGFLKGKAHLCELAHSASLNVRFLEFNFKTRKWL